MEITYIISKIYKSYEYEWLIEYIDSTKYKLSFILLNDRNTPLEEFIKQKRLKFKRIKYSNKIKIIPCTIKCIRVLNDWKPTIINCNLLDATLIGLLAGYFARIKNRLYTRHHTTFHHVYRKKGVFYDRLNNFLATKIIAISQNVKKVLMEYEDVLPDKIEVVPYGYDFSIFDHISEERITALRKKYKINKNCMIIGIVSRYTKWKGIQYILPAIKSLQKLPNINLHIVLANAGRGDYSNEIRKLLNELNPNSYTEIEFEEDIGALFKLFDIFVHTPIDYHSEAFGRVYIEASLSRVPIVCTKSGIANDFVVHKQNAFVASFNDSASIEKGVLYFLNNMEKAIETSRNAYNEVSRVFNIERNIYHLETIYDNLERDA